MFAKTETKTFRLIEPTSTWTSLRSGFIDERMIPGETPGPGYVCPVRPDQGRNYLFILIALSGLRAEYGGVHVSLLDCVNYDV